MRAVADMTILPDEYPQHEGLASSALSEWAPGASFRVTPLTAGFSAAAVFKLDVRYGAQPRGSDAIESGQYILKVSPRGPRAVVSEAEAHRAAFARNEVFARAHIPALCREFTSDSGSVLLSDIAGLSLDAYRAANREMDAGFRALVPRLIEETLSAWIDLEPNSMAPPDSLFLEWLEYRLQPVGAPRLHQLIDRLTGGKPYFVDGARQGLPNPLRFIAALVDAKLQARPVWRGLLHRDLHGGNILLHRQLPAEQATYWTIDFGEAYEGPAFYDQAYLELSHILYCLRTSPGLANLHAALPPLYGEAITPTSVSGPAAWLAECVRDLRDALAVWQRKYQARRKDDWNRQMLLARVAVGLAWANKRLDEDLLPICVSYAAVAARQYMEHFEPTLGERLDAESVFAVKPVAPSNDDKLLDELWQRVHGFDATAARFVLVAEGLRNVPETVALGKLPWSVIIDLDPESDEHGLRAHALPVLERHLSVHSVNSVRDLQDLDYQRAAVWMLAAGWSLKGDSPTNYADWIWQKMQEIRALFRRLYEFASPEPIVVVLVPGRTLDPDMPLMRLTKIASGIAESTQNSATQMLLGNRDVLELVIGLTRVPVEPRLFLQKIAEVFGTDISAVDPTLPGPEGPRPILTETLRILEENFDVLHSRALEQLRGDDVSVAFPLGPAPSFIDLSDGIDVRRSVQTRLCTLLEHYLEQSRNQTVVLQHHPGSGGTTIALRAAWELRRKYPCLVLRSYTSAIVERLASVFAITERPILIVAESAQLSEAQRDLLYVRLRQGNVRVVLLYVRHYFSDLPGKSFIVDDSGGDVDRGADAASEVDHGAYTTPATSVSEPSAVQSSSFVTLLGTLDEHESKLFFDDFYKRTTEESRRSELGRITFQQELIRYRTPFFYGLLTFGRDFSAVDRYVEAHLNTVNHKQRAVLQYISVITIYSNGSLHEGLFRSMFGLSAHSKFPIEEIIGVEPARLVMQRNGGLRVTHQVVAEEIMGLLSPSRAASWYLDLDTISIDLIHDLARHASPKSEIVLDMLRKLFTERLSGESFDLGERAKFSPIIEVLDNIEHHKAARVLRELTVAFPEEAHFWNHRGRHQVYRANGDLEEAEQFLLKATELSPLDFIQWHTLGVVRRYRAKEVAERLVRTWKTGRAISAEQIKQDCKGHFDGAVSAFSKSRDCNPENIYAYVTHVETILDVLSRMMKVSNGRSIADVRGETAESWVQEQLGEADALLAGARTLYGTLAHRERDKFYKKCVTALTELYGEFDEVIRIWEMDLLRRGPSSFARRALARAYLRRREGKWRQLQPDELRRVVDLAQRNLRSGDARGQDFQLWFDAYRLMADYDASDAIANLRNWTGRFPVWQAHYYTYVVNFIEWFNGHTERTDAMLEAMERTGEAVIGNPTYSITWMGNQAGECPLVADEELGRWERDKRVGVHLGFWSDETPLLRVNGVIETIRGPQAGEIRIDSKVPVFFVPGRHFLSTSSSGKRVNFYLGFSPKGLRAWCVEPNWVAEGERRGRRQAPDSTKESPSGSTSAQEKQVALNRLALERAVRFCDDLLATAAARGQDMTVGDVVSRALAVCKLGVEYTAAVEKAVMESGRYELIEDIGQVFVRGRGFTPTNRAAEASPAVDTAPLRGRIVTLRLTDGFGFIRSTDETRDIYFKLADVLDGDDVELQFGGWVEFELRRGRMGPVAKNVRAIVDESVVRAEALQDIPKTQLQRDVEHFLVNFVEDGPLQRRTLPEIIICLDKKFPVSGGVARWLGAMSISDLIKNMGGRLRIMKTSQGDQVELAGPILGRIGDIPGFLDSRGRLGDEAGVDLPAERPSPAVAAEAFYRKAREIAQQIYHDHGTTEMPLGLLMKSVERRLPGQETVTERCGCKSTRDFLESSGFEVRKSEGPGKRPLLLVSRRQRRSLVAEAVHSVSEQSDTKLRDLARKVLREAGEDGLALVKLGPLLSAAIPGKGSLGQRLRAGTLSKWLKRSAEFELLGEGPQMRVRLRSRRSKTTGHPRQSEPVVAWNGAEVAIPMSVQEARARAREVIAAALDQHDGQGVALTEIGDLLTRAIPGEGKVAARLGAARLLPVLERMSEFEIYGDSPHMFIRWVQGDDD